MTRPDSSSPPSAEPIPVTLIAGFLGSGKTTMLNHLLNENLGLRAAILVNDFGEVDIDSALLEGGSGWTPISLPNGCICCSIRGALQLALKKVLETDPRPEAVLIETSGVASPCEVAGQIQLPVFAGRLRLDCILTLVDADRVLRLAEIFQLLPEQIACSDLIVVNKVDRVSLEQLDAVRRWLDEVAPQIRRMEVSYGKVPAELISSAHLDNRDFASFGLAYSPFEQAGMPRLHSNHPAEFATWTGISKGSVRLAGLQAFVESLPEGVLRVKGLLELSEVQGWRVVLQMVGRRAELFKQTRLGAKERGCRLVVIARSCDIDPSALNRGWQALQQGRTSLGGPPGTTVEWTLDLV